MKRIGAQMATAQAEDSMADAVFINEQRKARKPHICSACGKEIPTGIYYRYIKGVKGKNGFYLNYICHKCYEDKY